MSYIGRGLQSGAFRQLDDISSGFDGSDTTHTMQVNSTNVTVGDVNQILLSLGGVIQKPGTDFTVSSSTLTFTTAPAANTSFFAILLGSDNGGTVTPTDGSVTSSKLSGNLETPGTLHIKTADAGNVTASTQADDLVVENSAEGKLASQQGPLDVKLIESPKHILELTKKCQGSVRIGFKLETGIKQKELVRRALAQIEYANMTAVIANRLEDINDSSKPRAYLVDKTGSDFMLQTIHDMCTAIRTLIERGN